MEQEKQKRILIIKLGALGDFIWQTGEMKAICERYPSAHITLMTGAPFIKIAKQTGWFDDYIIDNRTWNPLDWIRIVSKLAYGHFDIVFDIQMQNRTKKKYYALSRFFSSQSSMWAFEVRGGFNTIEFTKKCPLTWGRTKTGFMELVRQKPTLAFCHGENKNFHLLPEKYVLLIPGCSPNHPYKRWPSSMYAELAVSLAKDGIQTVVVGTSAEEVEIKTICAATNQAVNFCNKSSLLDIPDLARRALAVVGNDTGPLHMASVAGAPTVALFCKKTEGSMSKLSNVHNLVKENIADISVQEVMKELHSLIHSAKKSV